MLAAVEYIVSEVGKKPAVKNTLFGSVKDFIQP
jgi:hypothetical protein